ncbi:MAG: ATP-binding cassette domain-containing protein [Phycisphaeraceae bacterium]|nr:ATP-binding cassette domain-containing protein [Phycisphaeraceae bacterium]
MISVRDLRATYGGFTLHDVNLDLREGGCLAILGPSGAGKTLLLETVMGARRPRGGEVLLDGRNITALPPEARRIAYIPQDLALFPHLSVRDNIVFGLPSRAARRTANDVITKLAAMLRIEHILNRRNIGTLSGGERQRVALARAMIVQPRVLFLDEPFSSLDAATASDLLWSFREMRTQTRTTVFLVTHNLHEASLLADDVAIMIGGRIVESGPRDRVFRHPSSVTVARFLNIRNIIPMSDLPPQASHLVTGSSNGCTHLAIRSEDVVLSPVSAQRGVGLRGRLDELIPCGSSVIARLTVHGTWRLEVVLNHARAAELQRSLAGEVAVSIPQHGALYLHDTQDARSNAPGRPSAGTDVPRQDDEDASASPDPRLSPDPRSAKD